MSAGATRKAIGETQEGQAVSSAEKKAKKKMMGIVAAPHYLAAQVGAEVLANGGNAFDAAVSVALAIGVTQPYHSGIGGGCNITYRKADGEAGQTNAPGAACSKTAAEAVQINPSRITGMR